MKPNTDERNQNLTQKRIVVSGAAGFIGSHMCDHLLAEGHTVVALDNFLTGNPGNLAHLEGHTRFRFVEQDITLPFAVDGPVDGVVNMASTASPKDYLKRPIETLDVGSILWIKHVVSIVYHCPQCIRTWDKSESFRIADSPGKYPSIGSISVVDIDCSPYWVTFSIC